MAKYTVLIEQDEEGWFVSEVVELPGCHAKLPRLTGKELGKIIKRDLGITRDEFEKYL